MVHTGVYKAKQVFVLFYVLSRRSSSFGALIRYSDVTIYRRNCHPRTPTEKANCPRGEDESTRGVPCGISIED